jgi:TRAP-type mannitol/chloroaromatic compound transport system permease small subunit
LNRVQRNLFVRHHTCNPCQEARLQPLLAFSRAIDALNIIIGKVLIWIILAVTLISAANAIVRKAFNISSNAFLEIQWYGFATVFMLGAGYVFLRNAHVRIDFVSGRLSKKTQAAIDIAGIIVFLVPLCWLMIDLGWPVFRNAWVSGEMSQNAGGLIRWPVYLLVPLGFALLLAQAVSELIKRIAFLAGALPDMVTVDQRKTDEERLAEELKAETERKAAGALP